MGEINVQFVRPDRLVYEGPAHHLILTTYAGELGVWPSHAAEICALGDGVVRLHRREQDGGGVFRIVVSGGYAEIDNDNVIILADHARRADDIDPEVVLATRAEAKEAMESVETGDHRRAYYENRINWCNLLLKEALGYVPADPA